MAIGRTIRRHEDEPLVRGTASYVADLRPPGMLSLAIVRSPLAHGSIVSVETEAARRASVVPAVWTAADLKEDLLVPRIPPRVSYEEEMVP